MAADPWKALLHMSTKLTVEDPTEDSVPTHDPKNLEFLQMALVGEQQQGPTIIERFFLVGLQEPSQLAQELTAVEAAMDLADQLEDFFTMGNFAQQFLEAEGFKAMSNLVLSPNSELQLLYLRLIPLIAENRPEYQTQMAQSELLPHLLHLLSQSNLNSSTKQAAISAISSCVRSCPSAWDEFIKVEGLRTVSEKLEKSTEDNMVVAKAAHFLLSCHRTLIDPVLPPLQQRPQLETAIMNAYVALMCRIPGMTETELEFAEDTKKSLGEKLCSFPPSSIDKSAKTKLQTVMCELNREAVHVPQYTSDPFEGMSSKERKNLVARMKQRGESIPERAKVQVERKKEVVTDEVAEHYKIPIRYTVEQLKNMKMEEEKAKK